MKGWLTLAAIAALDGIRDRQYLTLDEAAQLAASTPAGALLATALGSAPQIITGDGAIPLTRDGTYVLTKGSAAAITVASPTAAQVGRRITVLTGSDFAHVVTFTGTTLADGTAGLNTTWTATALAGCSITFQAVAAGRWNVVSFNLGTIAP